MSDEPHVGGSGNADPGAADADPVAPRSCPWCGTPAATDAATCSSCGAALAQRESIGDLRIPGLTAVDPALEDFDKRPMHLRGPSRSQGVAPALIVGAAAGGPIGAMLVGGVAAVAAAEYLGARQGGPGGTNPQDVGKPSELLLQALEREASAGGDGAAGGGRGAAGGGRGAAGVVDVDPGATGAGESGAAGHAEPGERDAADGEGGMSIWRDLPRPTEDQG